MKKLVVEVCPETGICSILRQDGRKVDLMPDEAAAIRDAAGDAAKIRTAIAGCDSEFAESLKDDEIAQIRSDI